MLFRPPWLMEPVRLQGAYVTDAEIEAHHLVMVQGGTIRHVL